MTQENESKNSIGMRHVYVECACSDPSHVFRIELDVWDNNLDPELALTIQLNPNLSFFRRLYYAFKYVFRMPFDYNWGGQWDAVVLDSKAVEELEKMIVSWKFIKLIRQRRKRRQRDK